MSTRPTEPTDADLVQVSRGGDRDAFDLLVKRHMKQIYALAHRLTGSHDEADDLAQETFIRAHRGLHRFRGEARFSTWLTRILLNLARNPRRIHVPLQAVPEPVADKPAAWEQVAAAERRRQLRAAVASLPERQRQSVLLRIFAGLPYREIAGVMGTTTGTAKANVSHALRKLARRLGGAAGGGPTRARRDT